MNVVRITMTIDTMGTKSYFFAIILLFGSLLATGQSQRMLVPKLTNVPLFSEGEILFTSAFCIDPLREVPWPNVPLNYIFYGASTTWVTILYKNRPLTVTLEQGIAKGYFRLVGEGAAGIAIKPNNKAVKLVKARTNGILVGEQNEPLNVGKATLSIIPPNPRSQDILQLQKKLHKAIVAEYVKNNKDILPEYAENVIRKYLKHYERSPYWDVTVKQNKIFIHEKKIVFSAERREPFDLLMHDLARYDDLAEIKACINIDSSGALTANITGSYKGLIPITIDYSSDNAFKVSAELSDAKLTPHQHVKTNISIEYEEEAQNNSANDSCGIEFSATICFPLVESSITAKVCGTEVSLSPKSIALNF